MTLLTWWKQSREIWPVSVLDDHQYNSFERELPTQDLPGRRERNSVLCISHAQFFTCEGKAIAPVDISDSDICFAVLETLAILIFRRIICMSAFIHIEHPLRVDGGVSSSSDLLSLLATMLNKLLIRPKGSLEMASLGTAVLAGIGSGFWTSEEGKKFSKSVEYGVISPLSIRWQEFLKQRLKYRID